MVASDDIRAPRAAKTLGERLKPAPRVRFALLLGVAAAELLILSLCFSLDFLLTSDTFAAAVLSTLANALPMSMILAAALLGIGFARPGALSPILDGADEHPSGVWPLVGHFVGFLGFAATLGAAQYTNIPLTFNQILLGLVASALLAGACYARLVSPFSAWLKLLQNEAALLLAASATALSAIALGVAAQDYWRPLSDATLELSRLFLTVLTENVTYDAEQRLLGARDFAVEIAKQCSGYEGVALILSFLAFFGYAFRKELRFPHFLLLAPIGVAVIWISNSIRIALLVLVGAEISAPLAAGGFHSFAGLALFLIVTLIMMLTALHMPFFRKDRRVRTLDLAPASAADDAPTETPEERKERIRTADAMLLPFLAFLISGIALTMFVELPSRFYLLRVVAMLIALGFFWSVYKRMDWTIKPQAYTAGLVVAIIWIAAAPAEPSDDTRMLMTWLDQRTDLVYGIWLLARTVGFVLLVPLVEELVFRGYLHRAIHAGSYEKASESAFSWRAFVVTSVLFGALHGRFIEGAIAGALFAWAMYSTGRLSNAVVAHAVANGAILIYVLATGHWAAL